MTISSRPDRDDRRYALGILLATPIHRLADYAVDMVGADTVHVSTEILGAESVAYRGERRDALRHDIVDDPEGADIPVLVYTVNHQAGGEPRPSPGRDRSRRAVHGRSRRLEAALIGARRAP